MNISIDRQKLEKLCRKYKIRKLSIFGSALRSDFSPDSDVDVLVEFENGCNPGLSFFTIQEELSKILGRNVDLNTRGFISPAILENVLKESVVQYVAP